MAKQKVILIVSGVVIVLSLGYLYLWIKSGFIDHGPPMQESSPTISQTTPSSVDEDANWTIYRSEQNKFEIEYPQDWSVREYRINSTDRTAPSQTGIRGSSILFTAPPTCDFPACEGQYPRKRLPIQVFPANPDDTTLTALSRVKGNDVFQLDIKPLTIGGSAFNYYSVYENIIDATFTKLDVPALVKNSKLYIITCDTITGTHTILDDCNMNTEELKQALSTFKFID